MVVSFLHPRGNGVFTADVDRNTTAKTCLDGLVAKRFIKPAPSGQPYAMLLTRNQKQILPRMTMQDAGVQERDAFVLLQQGQGATESNCRRLTTAGAAWRQITTWRGSND